MRMAPSNMVAANLQSQNNGGHAVSLGGLSIGALVALCVATAFALIGLATYGYRSLKRRREESPGKKLSTVIKKGLMEDAKSAHMTRTLSLNSRSSSRSSQNLSPSTPEALHMMSECGTPEDGHLEGGILRDVQLGNLTFSVLYDKTKQILLVTIVRCDDLPAKDPQVTASSDPYVKLQLLPDKRHKVKTRVLRKTTSPVYEETFSFYGITPGQIKNTSLHFVVLSFDRFSRDDIIGEVLFPLGETDLMGDPFTVTRDIQPRQFKIRNQNRGELLVSLCYQPAANRLTVVVLKARNLPKMDVTGLAGDPYVKLYLLYNGQRIAKKKTHVKKRTLNPVYNESFVFEVPANENLHNLSLEMMLLDWDRVTKNEVIGKMELGLGKTDLADKHWQEVMNCPRKQIAEWHKLTE